MNPNDYSYYDGEWYIYNPGGSTSINQYDGADESIGVNFNGLNLNFFLLEVTHIAIYGLSSVIAADAQVNLYDINGITCTTDVRIETNTRGEYPLDEIKQLIPISSFIGTCDTANIGAIEIIFDTFSKVNIYMKRISLYGPLAKNSPTPSPTASSSGTIILASTSRSPFSTPPATTSPSASRTPTRTSTPTNTQTSTVSLSPGSLFTSSQTRTPSGSMTPSTTKSASVSDTPTTQITRSSTITSIPSKSQTPLQSVLKETKSSTPTPTTSPSITIEISPGSLIGSDGNFDICSLIQSQSEIISSRTKHTILLTKDNEVVGYLNIPSESFDSPVFVQTCSDTKNDISQSNNNNFLNQDLGNVIVDITMQDTFGNLITQFDVPIEICLIEDQIFVCI